jgi:hypothetical protein
MEEDAPRGLLIQFEGKSFWQRLKRATLLSLYHPWFKWMAKRVDFFCFWSLGDFALLKQHYSPPAEMLRFQYGAHRPEALRELNPSLSGGDRLRLMMNHSGSTSGNHIHLLKKYLGDKEGLEVVATLSYGNSAHIGEVINLGRQLMGDRFLPMREFMKRKEYFHFLSTVNILLLGHKRQEAGNTLFLSFILGTKVILHPESVLVPYLDEKGYVYFTWDHLLTREWSTSLDTKAIEINKKLALEQFSEERFAKQYQDLLRRKS